MLRVSIDEIVVCHRNGGTSHCGPSCISRSQLLQDIRSNCKAGEEAHAQVPLSEDSFIKWMSQVNLLGRGCFVVELISIVSAQQVVLYLVLCHSRRRRLSFNGSMQVTKHAPTGGTDLDVFESRENDAVSMCTLLTVSIYLRDRPAVNTDTATLFLKINLGPLG